MTLDYYKLREHPFGGIPDPRFLFVTSAHQQALGTVLVALQKGSSCVSLLGHPGLGKTTLLYHMFNTLKENVTTIYLFQPPQSQVDFLRALLSDLGVLEINEVPEEMFFLLKDLCKDQLEQGKRVVVIIDEAQNLTAPVLELVALLSSPTSAHCMLQFILSGQSQMTQSAVSAESAQLNHRSPVFARLEPLNEEDTAQYVDHRLRIAGYDLEEPLFTPEASALIARYSEGVPRKINNLSYSSMSLGYNTRRDRIEADIVLEVVNDLGLDRTVHRSLGGGDARWLSPPRKEPEIDSPAALDPFKRNPAASLRKPVTPARMPLAVPAFGPSVAARTPSHVSVSGTAAEQPQEPHSLRSRRAATNPSATGPFSGLIPKLGLAAAVLLTVAATLVNVRRHAVAPAFDTPAHTVVLPSPAAASPALPPPSAASAHSGSPVERVVPSPRVDAHAQPRHAQRDLKGMDLNSAVRALSGRSLNAICKANFGQCDSKQLEEMKKVNERLANHPRAQARGDGTPKKASEAATSQAEKAALTSPNP